MSTFDVCTKDVQDAKVMTEDVVHKVEESVQEDANVVVIGCNGLGTLCTIAGVTSIGEAVPLVDCVSVVISRPLRCL